ncbi:hypothetical protein TRIUR3_03666 [Triticum urartu]|uniref:Translocon-associated protein subunit beta n=1 Tax=Triticum urartu TaxID=4572 RepID=M7ZSI4_TRIUA|nr:hypothetical protein TRIUR3_03666 [Triticum urartu]
MEMFASNPVPTTSFSHPLFPGGANDGAAAVALSLLAVLASVAVGDTPFVVAHKRVKLSRPGPGIERLAVTLDLYNQGSATAYDVRLNDDSWPQEAFELVSGSTSKMVEKLDP